MLKPIEAEGGIGLGNPEMDTKTEIQQLLVDLTTQVALISGLDLFDLSDAIKDEAIKALPKEPRKFVYTTAEELDRSLRTLGKPIHASSYKSNQI